MNFLEACEETVKEAEHHNKVAYLYKNRIGNFRWGVSHQYLGDWLFKAYPGGRKILSVEGTKLAQSVEPANTGLQADFGWVCGECEFTNLAVDTVCQLCFAAKPKAAKA